MRARDTHQTPLAGRSVNVEASSRDQQFSPVNANQLHFSFSFFACGAWEARTAFEFFMPLLVWEPVTVAICGVRVEEVALLRFGFQSSE